MIFRSLGRYPCSAGWCADKYYNKPLFLTPVLYYLRRQKKGKDEGSTSCREIAAPSNPHAMFDSARTPPSESPYSCKSYQALNHVTSDPPRQPYEVVNAAPVRWLLAIKRRWRSLNEISTGPGTFKQFGRPSSFPLRSVFMNRLYSFAILAMFVLHAGTAAAEDNRKLQSQGDIITVTFAAGGVRDRVFQGRQRREVAVARAPRCSMRSSIPS